jgi:2-dehydro-3-deoxyglucarate aldolase/4-hydroxy-2-oxoheptanedioate aldolase
MTQSQIDPLEVLRGGAEPALGTWVKLPSLEVVEIIARTGYDFVIVDNEHSPLSLESTYRAIALGQALGLVMLVRVPDRSGGTVQRVLDSGADGLLIPQVADRRTAEAVGAQMTFSRDGGVRGMGSTSRAGLWGLRSGAEYLEHGAQRVVHAIQLEEIAALEQAEDLLDAPGVNAAFIGYGDLGLSSGLTADDPGLEELTRKVVDATRKRNMPIGTAVGTPAAAAAMAARGFTYVLVSNDASLFAAAAKNLADDVRQGWRDGR